MKHPTFYLEAKKVSKLSQEEIIQLFYRAVEKYERHPLEAEERLLNIHNWKSIIYISNNHNMNYYFLSSSICRIQEASWDFISSIQSDVVDVLIYLEDLGELV